MWVPKLGELVGPGAVPVCLFNLYKDSLEVVGPVVGIVEGDLDLAPVQFLFVHDGGPAVDPDGFIDAGNHEDETHVGIGFQILVGLKQLVTGHVGKKQVVLVQYGHEPRFASLGRGVAMSVRVGAGQDGEAAEWWGKFESVTSQPTMGVGEWLRLVPAYLVGWGGCERGVGVGC